MSIAIIDYGSGNLHSAAKAFERASRGMPNGPTIVVTSEPDVVRSADRIVLPGVGAYKDCRDGLMAVPGMWETLEHTVLRGGRPFLGFKRQQVAAFEFDRPFGDVVAFATRQHVAER